MGFKQRIKKLQYEYLWISKRRIMPGCQHFHFIALVSLFSSDLGCTVRGVAVWCCAILQKCYHRAQLNCLNCLSCPCSLEAVQQIFNPLQLSPSLLLHKYMYSISLSLSFCFLCPQMSCSS